MMAGHLSLEEASENLWSKSKLDVDSWKNTSKEGPASNKD